MVFWRSAYWFSIRCHSGTAVSRCWGKGGKQNRGPALVMLIFHWGGSDKANRGIKQGALRLYYINSPELFGGQRWPPWGSDISSESWRWVAVGQGDRKTPTEMPTHAKVVGGATHWKDHQRAGVTEPRGRKESCAEPWSARRSQTHWPRGLMRSLALEPQDSVLRILDLGSDGPDCVVVAISLL